MKIISSQIKQLLKKKHEKDLFLSECKTGRTWGDKVYVFDGWAMKKSWSNPEVIGYEIKVSRGDFLSDKKWRNYLPYCNTFYFVCPRGIVDVKELPEDTGLILVSKTGTKLYTKKKAPYREMEFDKINSVYKYILMWRAVLHDKNYSNHLQHEQNVEYWKNWVNLKKEQKSLGRIASRQIREIVKTKICAVETNNIRLVKENEALQDVKEILGELGIKEYQWKEKYTRETAIKNALHKIEKLEIENKTKNLVTAAISFLNEIENIKGK
jgi:hypothetical protein